MQCFRTLPLCQDEPELRSDLPWLCRFVGSGQWGGGSLVLLFLVSEKVLKSLIVIADLSIPLIL